MTMFSREHRGALIFFAQGVLIAPVPPGLDLPPWLRGKKPIHLADRQHPSAARFAIAVFEMCQAGEQPHRKKRDRRPKRPSRFGDETTAAGTEHTMHFRDRAAPVRQDREKARCDEDIEAGVWVR